MKLIKFIILAIISLLSSCLISNENKITIPNKIFVEKKYKDSNIGLKTIGTNEILVELERTEESVLSNNLSICVTNNCYIIWDRKVDKVYLFKLDGQFYKVLSSLGDGPEEYKSISNIVYNSHKKEIAIIDTKGHKLIIYDQWGEEYNIVDLTFNPGNYLIFTEQDYILMTYSDSKNEMIESGVVMIDSMGDVVKKYLAEDSNSNISFMYYSQNMLIERKDSLYYCEFPHIKIKQLSTDLLELNNYFNIDLGSQQMLNEDFNDRNHNISLAGKGYLFSFRFIGDYIWLHFVIKNYGQYYLFDVPNKKLRFMSFLGAFNDDLKDLPPFYPKFVNDTIAIDFLDPVEINEKITIGIDFAGLSYDTPFEYTILIKDLGGQDRFGVELHAEIIPLEIAHRREGTVARFRQRREPRRHLRCGKNRS